MNSINDIDIILASGSPRRRQLLEELGLNFRIVKANCEEVCPSNLQREEIPLYLSNLKSDAVTEPLKNNSLIITADTIVWADNKALGKPQDKEEAREMLLRLSDKTHEVITGITLRSLHHKKQVYTVTQVTFDKLSDDDINFYIEHYHPFDKAGAYGIQEWIGMIGVKSLNGCYYNVVGLPVQQLYQEIKEWEF